MFNKNLITLFLALICFQTINAYTDVSMKKEDVLKLETKFGLNNTCPEYAINDNDKYVFNYCHYNFYCLEDDCYSTKTFDVARTVNIKNEDGQVKTLGINRICNKNDDCLTNVCNNGRCDSSLISQCTVPFSSDLEKVKVHCGKVAQTECKSNDECASDDCRGVCQVIVLKEAVKAIKLDLFDIGAIVLLAVVCCIDICYCCCCRKSKEEPMV